MQKEREKLQRVYVTAKDPDTGKSATFTVYCITPEQFCQWAREQSERCETIGASEKSLIFDRWAAMGLSA